MKHPSTADTPDEEKQLRCIWRSQPYDLSQLRGAVGSFFQHIAWGDVVAVQAPMGTGKTTFVSALAQVLGAQDVASSPTFALCQEYPLEERAGSTRNGPFVTWTCTGSNTIPSLRGLGWDELMEDAGAITLVEWPERAADHFPDRAKLLRIERQPDGLRLASLWVRETA